MAGYWPRSFFACLSRPRSVHNHFGPIIPRFIKWHTGRNVLDGYDTVVINFKWVR